VIIFDQLRPRTDDRRDTSDDRDALEADAGVFSAGLFFRRFSARRLAFFDQAAESQMPWPEIRLYANYLRLPITSFASRLNRTALTMNRDTWITAFEGRQRASACSLFKAALAVRLIQGERGRHYHPINT
jgi:hypothetical protein